MDNNRWRKGKMVYLEEKILRRYTHFAEMGVSNGKIIEIIHPNGCFVPDYGLKEG